MLSSTVLDLGEQRKVTFDALARAGFFPIDMKEVGARPGVDVISSSMKMVDDAHAYFLLLGRRYGATIEDAARNPKHISTTHLEFERAVERGIPIVVILLADSYLLPAFEERDAERAKRDQLRSEAKATGLFEEVATPVAFGVAVADAAHYLRDLLHGRREQTQAPPDAGFDVLFAPPRHAGVVERSNAVRTLREKRNGSSILIVTGLPGNGKSVLTEQLARALVAESQLKRSLWIACERGDSLESLLARLSVGAGLKAQTTKAQCKELLEFLRREQALMVLEDFQACEQETMRPLLSLAAGLGEPARVILISRVVPDEAYDLPGVAIEEVANFDRAEIEALLALRGIEPMAPRVVDELIEKTAALPFAVGLFCGLVGKGKADPRALLAGSAIWETRLKKWFVEIEGSLTARANRLLGMLALVDGPFEEAVVQMFAAGASEEDIRDDFSALQRMFLIERWGADRWKMHDLVSSLGKRTLSGPPISAAYASLGRHYRIVAADCEYEGDAQAWFEYQVRACRAFERSGGHDEELQAALKSLAAESKRRGAHFMFLELSRNLVIDRRCSNPWLIYDFAHCCYVLGLYEEAAHQIHQALQSTSRRDPTLRLSLCRLQAEALAATGKIRDAFEILGTALSAAEDLNIRATNYAQAHSVMADLERRLGRFADAHRRVEWLIQEAEERASSVGGAVALVRKGHLMLDMAVPAAAFESFEEARDVFADIDNPRGEAWALVGLARTALKTGQFDRCAEYLDAAVPLHDQVGGYDSEYESALQNFQRAEHPVLQKLVSSELARVQAVKVERRELARRLQRAMSL